MAQALETKTSEAVFIDIVSVVGDSALKTADVIEALDIILGQGLSRYALNEAVYRGEQRLKLGRGYLAVEMKLSKGKQRQHFNLEVTVVPLSRTYFGGSIRNHEYKEVQTGNWNDFDETYKKTGYSGYLGSRNLFGTGLRSDVEISWSSGSSETKRRNSDSSELGAVFSLFNPPSADKLIFYGVNFLFSYTRDKSEHSASDVYSYSYSNQSKSELYLLQPLVGFRKGFTTFTLAPARFFSWSQNKNVFVDNRLDPATGDYVEVEKKETDHYRSYATILTIGLRYSEKSYLAALESGLEASISDTRWLIREFSFQSTTLSLANTWLLGGVHGLKPMGILQYQWTGFDSSTELKKKYDAGIRYDFASKWEWIFGVDRSIYGEINTPEEQRYEALPIWRTGFYARYVSPTFGAEIAFIYGGEGLSNEHFVFSSSGNNRTQQ